MAENEKPDSTANGVEGDNLEHLSEFATIITAAQDALSDDMVVRFSSVFSETVALLDRLTRNEGLMYFLRTLDRPENQRFLINLADALAKTNQTLDKTPKSKGGIGEMMRLLRDPGMVETLRTVAMIFGEIGKQRGTETNR